MHLQSIKKAFSWMIIALTFYIAEARGTCATFIKTATGSSHALYLQSDNTVWASGDNTYGQLGNGITGTSSAVRVPVENLTNAIDIAAGYYHSLALLNDGTVWSWGHNSYGQLGTGGANNNSNIPFQVLLPNDGRKATAIAAGQYFSLALLDDGTVWTFGRNDFGQLGNNTNVNQSLPIQVANNFKAKTIAAGQQHALAIQLSDDVVYGWGDNGTNQIGDGTTTQRRVPTATSGSFKGKAIAGGLRHSLAIRLSDDVVFGWGYNSNGQVGDGTTTQRTVPTQTSGAFAAKAIAAGELNSLAIRFSNNTVYAWGDNTYGALGNGTVTSSSIPTPTNAVNLTGASSISAFYHTAQAIRNSDSSPWGWGANSNGALGVGYTSSLEPVPVALFIGPIITVVPTVPTTSCSEKTVRITFASNLPDTTYSWTIKNQDAWISGATEESDQAYFEQLLSVTQNEAGTIVYTIIPQINGCIGLAFDITVLINPLPVAQATPSEQTLCSGEITNIQLKSNILDTTFSYTVAYDDVNGAYGGSGDLIQQGLLATKNIPGTVVYTITPEASGCSGDPITVLVHVNACTPTSPSHFCGKLKNINGCYFHSLKWTPSLDASVTAYYLYADGELIQTIPATGPYEAIIPYAAKPNGVDYRLVAVNEFGAHSTPSLLLLRSKKECVDNCSPHSHCSKNL